MAHPRYEPLEATSTLDRQKAPSRETRSIVSACCVLRWILRTKRESTR